MRAIPFSWRFNEVPHGILDINRICNISCLGCYNSYRGSQKSLSEIETELAEMLKSRSVHTVSIAGGEPTLHPDLFKIIRLIKSRKLSAAIISNGLLIDKSYARGLKDAQADLVFLHLDRRQKRPDLSDNPSYGEVMSLCRAKAEIISSCGIDTGLQVILYRGDLSELNTLVDFISESAVIDYLFITTFTEFRRFKKISGDVQAGLVSLSAAAVSDFLDAQEEITIADVVPLLKARNMRPFAYLGSNLNPQEERWLIYKTAILKRSNGRVISHSLTSSISDRVLIKLFRWIKGKYFFYHKESALKFKIQILLNAFSGGNFPGNLLFFLLSFNPRYVLRQKHILIQQGPTLGKGGVIEYCRSCPDAAIKNGKLIPVCLADKLD